MFLDWPISIVVPNFFLKLANLDRRFKKPFGSFQTFHLKFLIVVSRETNSYIFSNLAAYIYYISIYIKTTSDNEGLVDVRIEGTRINDGYERFP